MKHRHPGKYKSRTPKGSVVRKRRPLHPKTGSWISKKFIHGPRVRQPSQFKDMYIVSQDWARNRHLKINPPDRSSRVKVGTLRNNRLAVQSYITPLNRFKGKDYKYLRKKFGILKHRDDDKDKVVNVKDCRPFDKGRQDISRDERERALDNIRTLQSESRELSSEWFELDVERKELENRMEKEPMDVNLMGDYFSNMDQMNSLGRQIDNKVTAIKEEKEFLEEA